MTRRKWGKRKRKYYRPYSSLNFQGFTVTRVTKFYFAPLYCRFISKEKPLFGFVMPRDTRTEQEKKDWTLKVNSLFFSEQESDGIII